MLPAGYASACMTAAGAHLHDGPPQPAPGGTRMTAGITGRRLVALTGAMALAMGAAACSSGSDNKDNAKGSSADCADYKAYGDLKGKTVTVFTGIVTPEDELLKKTWAPFEKCTGATIKGTFDKSFETQVLVQAKAGNPPDIGLVPQPGLLKALVATGKAVPADAATTE